MKKTPVEEHRRGMIVLLLCQIGDLKLGRPNPNAPKQVDQCLAASFFALAQGNGHKSFR
jgi:hypothetical protein